MSQLADDSSFDDLLGASESPLDRKLSVTFFPNGAALRAERRSMSVRELAEDLSIVRGDRKEDLPWLKMATFGDQRTERGCLRHSDNVLSVDGIEADYDGEQVGVAEAIKRCESFGIAAMGFTSPSHTADRPRWRLLAPLSRSVAPAERENLCARLNGALGGILAPESFRLSQSYYFGFLTGATEQDLAICDGRALDEASDLDVGAMGADGRAFVPSSLPAANASEADDDDWEFHPTPDWERISDAIAVIPVSDADDAATGGRELYLRIGQALHDAGQGSEQARALWDGWSKSGKKYNASDLARDWRSFDRRRSGGKRVRIGTLFDLAKHYGWKATAEPDTLDLIGTEAAPQPQAATALRFLAPAECASSPSRGYVVKNLIAPGNLGCIFGAPGAGKSLIAPHTGYLVALGQLAFGLRTKPGRVLYVAAEDPHGMRGRVTALRKRHGDAPEFILVEGVSDLLASGSPDLAALRAAVADQRPTLIFLDTLATSFPGLEENTAEDMGRVVAIGRSLTVHDAAVVLIHHDTKAQGATPRGHSLLNGALDFALQLFARDETGVVRAKLTKNRNGTSDRDIAFRIATEILGEDEDGDAITAALVDELAPGAAPKREKLTNGEREALKIFEGLASGGPVAEDAWRAACVESSTVSASEDRKSRQTATRRAIEGLARKSLIIVDAGLIRRPGSIGNAFDQEQGD